LPSPFLDGVARFLCDRISPERAVHFGNERLFFGEIMDPLDDLFVPILNRLIDGTPDGKDPDIRALSLELRHFPVTKRLAEGGESFEQVGHLAHRRRLNGGREGCNSSHSEHDSCF
jgi:hypothetical protein